MRVILKISRYKLSLLYDLLQVEYKIFRKREYLHEIKEYPGMLRPLKMRTLELNILFPDQHDQNSLETHNFFLGRQLNKLTLLGNKPCHNIQENLRITAIKFKKIPPPIRQEGNKHRKRVIQVLINRKTQLSQKPLLRS